jgi:hypothetical protein
MIPNRSRIAGIYVTGSARNIAHKNSASSVVTPPERPELEKRP